MADVTFSDPFVFAGTTAQYDACCKLTTNKYLIAYMDDDDSNKGKCVVATVSGSDVYFGAIATFANYSAAYISCCQINTDKALIVWQTAGDASGQAMYITVSGTTITTKTETEFEDGQDNDVDGQHKIINTSCCQCDTDEAFIFYHATEGASDFIIAKHVSLNVDALTIGNENQLHSTGAGAYDGVAVCQMATDYAMGCWAGTGATASVQAVYIHNNAGTIEETAANFDVVGGGNGVVSYPSICALDADHAFIAFTQDYGVTDYSKGVVVKNDRTQGTVANFGESGIFSHNSAVALSSTKVMVFCRDEDETGDYGVAFIATIATLAATFDTTKHTFREKDIDNCAAALISESGGTAKVLVAFRNTDDVIGEAIVAQYVAIPTVQKYLSVRTDSATTKLRCITEAAGDYELVKVRLDGATYDLDLVDDNPPFNTFPVKVYIDGAIYQIRDSSVE